MSFPFAMYYKVAQLILTPGPKAGTTSEVFISQPDSDKENLAGKLFVLVEIESRNPNCIKFINFLISEINRNYYNNDKLILRERISTIKIEDIFESALAKTNKNIGDYFQNPGNYLDFGIINATIGVIFENQLHFSIVGKNRAFLVYQSKNASDTSKYKINEISQTSNEAENKTINGHKLFVNVVNGAIPENGYFIFANETLPEYLSYNQIIDITTTLPPISTVEQMKNLLLHVNAYVSFLGVVIKNTYGQNLAEPERIINRSSTTQASINNLKITEEKTERLLTPSGLIDFSKWLSKISSLITLPHFTAGRIPGSGKIVMTEKLSFRKRSSFKYLKNLLDKAKNGLIYLINFLIHIPSLFNKETVGSLRNNFKNSGNKILGIVSWFKNLNKKQQISITVALILIFLFFQNSLALNYKNQTKIEQQNFLEIAKKIEQKQNIIDSNLIYNNLDGASQQLSEIKNLLDQMPKNSDQYKPLFDKYDQQMSKVAHEIKVNPIEIANFNNLSNVSKPKNLALINNKIFAGDLENKTIYILDLSNKLVTSINSLPQPINSLDYPNQDKEYIYYVNGDNLIAVNSKDETTKTYSLARPGQAIGGTFYYNNKLYVLNTQENQIYRLTKSGDKFDNPTPWLKSNIDIKDAIGFAIDSSIYVLKRDGQITKLLRGNQETFNLDHITPPIDDATKLVVGEKNIYILEAKNKRIISFDKSGKLAGQYKSDKLDNLKDFVIDEPNKKAYLLNGSVIEEINL